MRKNFMDGRMKNRELIETESQIKQMVKRLLK